MITRVKLLERSSCPVGSERGGVSQGGFQRMAAKMQKNGSSFYKTIHLTEPFLCQLGIYLVRRTIWVRRRKGLAPSTDPGIVGL